MKTLPLIKLLCLQARWLFHLVKLDYVKTYYH
nr:MAG TPA: hypothetical protein [Caudoviricetes sp.]